jgi:hypothetical protein
MPISLVDREPSRLSERLMPEDWIVGSRPRRGRSFMKGTLVRIGSVLVAVTAVVALAAGTAEAHHVFIDVNATGDLVPGGDGDPDGSVTAVIDFNSEESPEVCIEGTSEGLDDIGDVMIIAKEDDTILLEFESGTLDSCVVTDDEQRHELHDNQAAYLLLVTTEEFPEGAVAGELIEQEPSTTTSSTDPGSSSTTAAPAAAAAAAASTSPRFTG